MAQLLPFLVLLCAGLFLSELFRRFHMPYVLALIAAGVIIGPFGLGLFSSDATTDFIANIGLIFLMFMAGIEVRLSSLAKLKGTVARMAAINGVVPFAAGLLVAWHFGYGWDTSFLLGMIFVSSSIAVVIPTLEASGAMHGKLGKAIVGSAIVHDMASLLALSFMLQTLSPSTWLPLPAFYALALLSLLALRYALPRIRALYLQRITEERELFEQEVRLLFAMLIGVAIYFELIGMHAVIAGFFTGLVLSDSMKSETLRKKLHAISYGLFIPVFFVIVGTRTDVSVFFGNGGTAIALAAAIIAGSMLSKFASGYFGARMSGFGRDESLLAASCTMPQLSVALAVAFVGLESGVLDSHLTTAIVMLTVVTVSVSAFLISHFTSKLQASGAAAPGPKAKAKGKKPIRGK